VSLPAEADLLIDNEPTGIRYSLRRLADIDYLAEVARARPLAQVGEAELHLFLVRRLMTETVRMQLTTRTARALMVLMSRRTEQAREEELPWEPQEEAAVRQAWAAPGSRTTTALASQTLAHCRTAWALKAGQV
jgi:hypothetical protein